MGHPVDEKVVHGLSILSRFLSDPSPNIALHCQLVRHGVTPSLMFVNFAQDFEVESTQPLLVLYRVFFITGPPLNLLRVGR